MKYGLSVPQFDTFGDIHRLVDLVEYGATPGADPSAGAAIVTPYQEAGATWWVEGISPFDYGFDWKAPWTPEIVEKLVLRVQQGPPVAG